MLPQKLKISHSTGVLWGVSEHSLGTVAPSALNFIHSFTNPSAYKYIIQNANKWASIQVIILYYQTFKGSGVQGEFPISA